MHSRRFGVRLGLVLGVLLHGCATCVTGKMPVFFLPYLGGVCNGALRNFGRRYLAVFLTALLWVIIGGVIYIVLCACMIWCGVW